ncbi:hypothetical protein GOP47_0005904 [Adiantum capillus-veneris]|uniref:adenylate kinase n=1 Tax=Adiantum capillus-veneris TaxID=13818 RepID=A0A9D4ZJU2_ADICA|nr:hypothetical protein GOP47_0005904 [Adiantum capillus-veneris]
MRATAAAARRLVSHSPLSSSAFRSPWARHAHAAAQSELSETWSSTRSPSSRTGPQWIFLGCPGVGKGTYASRLAKFLGVPHIAMGDLVRQELSEPTPSGLKLKQLMNEGKLLPDNVILELLAKRLEAGTVAGETGFILDGFPRTRSQVEALDKVTDIELVLNLRLREDVLVMKCLGRRICSGCGTNYNIANIDVGGENGAPRIFMPPLLPPPSCANKLIIRADDTEEVVRARLNFYAEESKPVENYYRAQEKLMDFDVIGGIPETWPKLLDVVRPFMPEESLSVAAA